MASAFVYGTLMHPKIITKVIGNDGSHLEICPAVLLDHTRHRVKHAEYPGVVPYAQGKALFDRELDQEERSVRGTLVRGLSESDIQHLDEFEGIEYVPSSVPVHPLSSFVKFNLEAEASELVLPEHVAPLLPVDELSPAVEAHVYIYQDASNLEPQLWSWEDFVRNSAGKWHGHGESGAVVNDVSVVEQRRAAMIALAAAANAS